MRSTSKIVWTSEQDAAIRRVYERRERGAARALARQWAISPRRISVRAAELGLPPLIASVSRQHPLSWQKSDLGWRDPECAIPAPAPTPAPVSGDAIVDEAINTLLARSKLGQEKYGTTLMRNDLSLLDWMRHAIEESLDRTLYMIRALKDLEQLYDDGR